MQVLISDVISLLGMILPFIAKIQVRSKRRLIIGVVRVPLPDVLAPYPDFTSWRKLMRYGAGVLIYHTDSMREAKKRCDFVVANWSSDCKIIDPSDTKRLASLLAGFSLDEDHAIAQHVD